MVAVDREMMLKDLIGEISAPQRLNMESWVRSLGEKRVERVGFVIYRNIYSKSDAEWATFVEKLEAGLSRGWDGVLDPDNVKRKATLHWIDGKKENIHEDDIEAIRE